LTRTLLRVPMPSQADPSRIPDDQWEYEGQSSDGLRVHYIHWVDRERGIFFRKTENLVEESLLKFNAESLNMSQGKRFNDEPMGTRVASIPLNIFYRDIAPRAKDGDQDFMKWFLNRSENRPYRTFRGKV
jgi:hypothetical protein